MEKRDEDIGTYVHIPFCISKCPYCDFNSVVVSPVPEEDYVQALIEEIGAYATPREYKFKEGGLKESIPLKNGKRRVRSIYFGGGTPSLFSPVNIERVIDKIISEFSTTSDLEITLEVNPKTADVEKLEAFYTIGVNRLSLGVQSFQDKFLQKLGRAYGSADAINLPEDARSSGFDNIGLDLIFGIPDQTLDDWERDLDHALSVWPQHLSVYNLTIEKDTPFYDLHGQGKITLPNEDIQVRMYELAQGKIIETGYEQYEISSFALPGFRCRHNEGYWTLREYLGFGAGAHSYLRERLSQGGWGIRWKNTPDPYEYFSRLSIGGSALVEQEELTRQEAVKEAIFLGLRRLDGISFDDFEKRFGLSLDLTFSDIIRYLCKEGLLLIDSGYLKLTP
ncbi:MAG: radical SAM family heme chaperone HemW, partial [Pseudomonadota bacterium]